MLDSSPGNRSTIQVKVNQFGLRVAVVRNTRSTLQCGSKLDKNLCSVTPKSVLECVSQEVCDSCPLVKCRTLKLGLLPSQWSLDYDNTERISTPTSVGGFINRRVARELTSVPLTGNKDPPYVLFHTIPITIAVT